MDARNDFLQAVEVDTPLPWPYFFLAQLYCEEGSFDECLKMCQHALALEFPMFDLMRGDLHEWMAISRAELGYTPDQVRSEFEEAIRCCPDDELIRRNLQAFERSLALPQGNSPPWENLAPSQLKSMIEGEYLSSISAMLPTIAA